MGPEIAAVLEGRSRWALAHADSAAALPEIAAGAVDHVVTDPPYAPRAMKNARSHETMKQRRDGKVYDFGYSALTDLLRRTMAVEFARLARRWVLVWCDIESAAAWRADMEGNDLRYIRTGIWVRENSAPQFSGDRPAQGVEACVIMHAPKRRLAWNGGGHPATWIGPIVNSHSGERVHTTPKPLWLMLKQIEQFTDPDDLVLDPFSGSGTTGVACLRLGRRFIGIERDEKYAAVARERLEAESKGLSLRDARAGQQSLFGVTP